MSTTTSAIPEAQRGNRAPTDLDYIEDRLKRCLDLIDRTRVARATNPAETKALVFMLGEEFHALLGRLWRCTR
jgi:hypothetical protein